MKKIFTLLFACSIATTFAQTIPSNDFETWQPASIGPYEEPSGWNTLNPAMFALGGIPSVTKVTSKFSGTYAANLRNVAINQGGLDTIIGGLLYTDIDITGKPLPGYLKGHIKYSLQPGDVGIISYGYKTKDLNGNITNFIVGIKKFEGSSSSFIPFTIKTNAQYYPFRKSELLTLNITSYNYWSQNPVAFSSQSNLTIDSLGFGGQSNPPTIVTGPTVSNGSFDNWYNIEGAKTPDSWFQGSALQFADTLAITQSKDAHSGNYALQLGIDPASSPAFIYTFIKPTTDQKFINGFSKFSLGKGDTVMAYLTKYTEQAGLDGDLIDSIIFTGNQDQYKAFALKINGKVKAGDTLALQFAAFNPNQFNNFRLEANPAFLVDDISIGAFPLAIPEEMSENTKLTVSPNPSANGIFNVRNLNNPESVKVYDVLGNSVEATISGSPEGTMIDISRNPRNVYFINAEKNNTRSVFRIAY